MPWSRGGGDHEYQVYDRQGRGRRAVGLVGAVGLVWIVGKDATMLLSEAAAAGAI